jgi:hypothetical protein
MVIGALGSGYTAPEVAGSAAPRAASAEETGSAASSDASSSSVALSPEALALIARLKARDTEVRQHEQAHLAAAGSLALSGASYVYQRGPDGVSYAIGGEVQIDTSPGRTPEETLERARAIAAAALAPAEPSGPDRAVAAQAEQMGVQARAQLAQQATQDPRSQAVERAYRDPQVNLPSINVTA